VPTTHIERRTLCFILSLEKSGLYEVIAYMSLTVGAIFEFAMWAFSKCIKPLTLEDLPVINTIVTNDSFTVTAHPKKDVIATASTRGA
jgi:hypothetical protein